MKQRNRNILMFWTLWLLAVALLVFVLSQIEFLLTPLRTIMASLFAPLLIAGFLFYLLNPVVVLLERFKFKRIYSIALVMILLGGLVVVFTIRGIPILMNQAVSLIRGIPDFIAGLENYVMALSEEPWMQGVNLEGTMASAETWLRNAGNDFLENLTTLIGELISTVTGAAFLLVTIPVILFYMLYDGWRFPQLAASLSPKPSRKYIIELLKRMNHTISSYVSGKGAASLIVGVLIYIGYVLIDLPSALLLAVFAGITNFIPYVGPFIGAAPAMFVGLTISPGTALLVGVIVLVVQQGDSNLFTPMFVGKSLDIHPLTVMLVLLAAGNMGGLVGMLIGVPVFALIKTIVVFATEVYRERKSLKERKETNAAATEG